MSSKSHKPKKLRQLTLFQTGRTVQGTPSPSPEPSPPRRKRTRKASNARLTSPSDKSHHSHSSDDDIERIELSPAKTPSRRRPSVVSLTSTESDEENASPVAPRIVRSKSRTVLTPPPDPGALETSDEEDGSPTKRRRLTKRAASPTSEDDLANEVDAERIIESRFRTRGKRSAYQKSLDKLKRRKLKNGSCNDDDSEANEETEVDDVNEMSEGEEIRLFRGAKPSIILDSDEEEGSQAEGSEHSDTLDFIEEDDGEAVELPPEFSMETHEDLAHHFKKVFQFFCHVAVQPASRRRDFMERSIKENQYFSVPLQVTRRKIDGLRDSLVISSVWRPEFKRLLEEHPNLEVQNLEDAVPQCDACRLSGRLSTRVAYLSGDKYEKVGFGPRKGRKRKHLEEDETPKNFYLGRFCARRTSTFHEFVHWEYELFKAIVNEIEELKDSVIVQGKKRKRNFHRVAYAGAKGPPEDLNDADEICDWLDSRHVVSQQWHKVNEMMENARKLDMFKNAEDD